MSPTSPQVKTLSFLTYLLRGFTPLMQPYEKQISSSVINLLRSCPSDAVATRKELLVATRHILATEFRKGFYSEVCCGVCMYSIPGVRAASFELRPLKCVR